MWDRFDICEAHLVLEWDYHVGGILQQRPSNQRRNMSTDVQLHRMGYRPGAVLSYRSLSDNAKCIYHELVKRWGLPAPTEPRRVKLVCGPDGSPNFCFGLEDIHTGESVHFVQSDWDYPALASHFGWEACECGTTDGTVKCDHKTATQMINDAYDFLSQHEGDESDWYDSGE